MKPLVELVRCSMASCDGTAKKLSWLGGCTKRCGLCDARRPFRRTVKCSECKTVYHRRCGKKLAAAAAAGVVVDGRERDVSPTATRRETVVAVDEHANADAMDAVRGGRKLMAADHAIIMVGYTTTDGPAVHEEAKAVVVRGGHDLLAADSAIMRVEYAATDGPAASTNAKTVVVRGGHDDPLAVDGAIVRAEYTATDGSGTTTTVVALPTPRPLPTIRATIISPIEYFLHLLLARDETKRKEVASSSVPRPVRPASSRLTRADYLEMSASWDPVTFKRIKKNESKRVVYTTVYVNSSVERSTVDNSVRGP